MARIIMHERYRLVGATASPYALKLRDALKLRALLRYRRIPFDWVIMTRALRAETARPRSSPIPTLQFPDGSLRGETTTLAHELEQRHSDHSVTLTAEERRGLQPLLDRTGCWAYLAET